MATTPQGLPYPLGSDDNDTAQDLQDLATELDTRVWNPGDIKATIVAAAPAGWLLLDGSTIVGANTAHPDLWAVAPASWKSGNDLNLPNMSTGGRALRGGGTLGSETGTSDVVLTSANLPPHNHTAPQHTHSIPDHDHQMDHKHAEAGRSTGQHLPGRFYDREGSPGSNFDFAPASVRWDSVLNPETSMFVGKTALKSGQVTGQNAAVNTGNGPGTSTPVDVRGAALRVNFLIKT